MKPSRRIDRSNRLNRLRTFALLTGVTMGITSSICGISGSSVAFADTNMAASSSTSAAGTDAAANTSPIDTSQLSPDELKILEIYQDIYQYHIDPVSEDTLMQGAITGMLQATGDPFSTYFSDSEYQQFIDSLDQKFVGIGIHLQQNGTDFAVADTISGGPSERAGLKAGDVFLTVNRQSLQGKSMDDVRNLLLGTEGSQVTVTVRRVGAAQPLTFTITRSQIQLPTVISKLTPEHLGYIQVADFSETVADEFTRALQNLKQQGAKGFIIDLRDNPGGVLQQAVQVADQFVKSGEILKTMESDGSSETFTADGQGIALDQPIVFLVNENSASAAEALSGSMKVLKRATVVGTKTFGKGTMQVGVPLQTGGVLKLTIGKYYLPDGSNPNHTGIEPNITIEYPDLQYNEAVQLLDPTRKQTLQFNLGSADAGQVQTSNPTNTQNLAGFSKVVLNGETLVAPAPINVQGVQYLPLRYILEAFGWPVTWDANTSAIACGDVSNQRDITSTTYTVTDNGQTHALKHALLYQNDSAYISVEDLQAAFPFSLHKATSEITVTQK